MTCIVTDARKEKDEKYQHNYGIKLTSISASYTPFENCLAISYGSSAYNYQYVGLGSDGFMILKLSEFKSEKSPMTDKPSTPY